MTLSEIISLALRQLDEDLADVSEYDDLFRRYADEGCRIVMREYVKPRKRLRLETDENGRISLEGLNVVRIVSLTAQDGRERRYALSPDGKALLTGEKSAALEAVAEMEAPPLCRDADVPAFAPWAHSCLADYICYRHLLSGSAAKQARAQGYLSAFHQTARRIRPEWMGSVTRLKNLYAATGTQ